MGASEVVRMLPPRALPRQVLRVSAGWSSQRRYLSPLAREHPRVGLTPVRARIAQDNRRRAGPQVVDDLLEELEPDSTIVRVAGHVGDAALAADPLRDGAEVALTLEHLRHLGDPFDEHEAPQLAEGVVE